MAENTREKFLEVARRQFAGKGYDGASIASIAHELGLSKQALLHHFGSKEKLYGEVLAAIATRLTAHALRAREAGADPVDQLEAVIVSRGDVEGRDGEGDVLFEAEERRPHLGPLPAGEGGLWPSSWLRP